MIDYFFTETLFSVPADAFRGHGSSLFGTRTSHLRGFEARAVPAGVAASTSNNYILFESCLINSLLIFEVKKILLSQPRFYLLIRNRGVSSKVEGDTGSYVKCQLNVGNIILFHENMKMVLYLTR